MPLIRVHRDVFLSNPDIHCEEGSVNLLDWLAQSDYQDIRDNGAQVRLNGVVIVDTTQQDPELAEKNADIEIGVFDTVDVVVVPEGGAVALASFSAVSFLFDALSIEIPKPETVDDQVSSNNQYNAATNKFRNREAIADIAGNPRVYPDFLQPSYFTFDSNEPVFKEWFLVGLGRYTITDIRSGETPITSLPNSSATVYNSSSFPSTIKTARTVDELSDLELITEQDPSRYAAVTNGTINNIASSIENSIDVVDADIIDELSLVAGDDILIQGEYFDADSSTLESINVQVEILSIVDSEITVDPGGASFPQSDPNTWNGSITVVRESVTTPWITLPFDDATEIFANIELPNGLSASNGGEKTITLTLSYQEIDSSGAPIGSIVSNTETITDNTGLAIRETFSYAVTSGRYRFRASNRSDFESGARQAVTLKGAYSAKTYSTSSFDEVTIIEVTRRVTDNESGRGNKVNCKAQRLLELFDDATGTFDTGNYTATRSFAQYAMYLLNKRAGVPVSDINYTELFAIEDSLGTGLGNFDYSFDDKNQSFRSRLNDCCNVARVRPYPIGNTWRFVREEAKAARSAIFNRRNIVPNASREKLKTFRDFDFDSIELEWINPDDNTPAYVRRRINPSTGAIETGLGDKAKEMKLNGCQTEAQAINRAELEIRRLRYQLWSVTDSVIGDALRVPVGARVGYASISDTKVFHGEIKEQDSATSFTTTEKFLPEGGVTYYVYIVQDDGTTNSVVATARSDGNEYGFEATGLTSYTADGYETQLGSIYVIAPDGIATDYVLTSRSAPDENGVCQVQLAQYDARMFEED